MENSRIIVTYVSVYSWTTTKKSWWTMSNKSSYNKKPKLTPWWLISNDNIKLILSISLLAATEIIDCITFFAGDTRFIPPFYFVTNFGLLIMVTYSEYTLRHSTYLSWKLIISYQWMCEDDKQFYHVPNFRTPHDNKLLLIRPNFSTEIFG